MTQSDKSMAFKTLVVEKDAEGTNHAAVKTLKVSDLPANAVLALKWSGTSVTVGGFEVEGDDRHPELSATAGPTRFQQARSSAA